MKVSGCLGGGPQVGSGVLRAGGESQEQPGSWQAGSAGRIGLCLCAGGGGVERLSLPAGPGGEAFELPTWGRRRAWANPASPGSFSNQLENVYGITRENRTNT